MVSKKTSPAFVKSWPLLQTTYILVVSSGIRGLKQSGELGTVLEVIKDFKKGSLFYVK